MTSRVEIANYLDPDLNPGGAKFEAARRAVAKELRWDVENVMNWEVRSYLRKRAERKERELSRAGAQR